MCALPILFYSPKAPYYEFSNFYESKFTLDGEQWSTSEHYFQASKFDHNKEYVDIIRRANTPYKAFILAQQKKKGGYASKWTLDKSDNRTLNDLVDQYKDIKIRSDWEDVKLSIMEKAVFAKFSQNEQLKKVLLDTGDRVIIEDSPRDAFWGSGKDGTGHNHLGKILMHVRSLLV